MKKKDVTISLTKVQKSEAVDKLKEYIEKNLECEVSGLQVSLLVDFISENLGVFYYDKGILDSISFINEKMDELYLLMKEES
ncbi:MAG: DUF2164 domain-containing protein [Oscillospiraceae bacterium]|nr:DUF2164 domain-containing protein [Oscillospiraceae bacterium]